MTIKEKLCAYTNKYNFPKLKELPINKNKTIKSKKIENNEIKILKIFNEK